jgi:hypothetical protein
MFGFMLAFLARRIRLAVHRLPALRFRRRAVLVLNRDEDAPDPDPGEKDCLDDHRCAFQTTSK